MATDIFQWLVDILQISSQLVNEYAVQGPLYQIFYLFFFPTLFIIVFIYILTSRWMGEHKGLQILIAVAVYAFIIFQGMYNWFVFLSQYWIIGLIILGFIWLVFRPRGGGGAQGKTLGAAAGGGILSKAFQQVNPVGGFRTDFDLLKTKIVTIYELTMNKGSKDQQTQNLLNEADDEIKRLSRLVLGKGQNPEIRALKEGLKRASGGKRPFKKKDI
ncbi:MAG: hypothetical protein V3U72_03840 [Candidatus Aenigmarchaeota archaeon]